MSKLANSHQPTMDEIDRQRAIENGYEDCIPNAAEIAKRTRRNYQDFNVEGDGLTDERDEEAALQEMAEEESADMRASIA